MRSNNIPPDNKIPAILAVVIIAAAVAGVGAYCLLSGGNDDAVEKLIEKSDYHLLEITRTSGQEWW